MKNRNVIVIGAGASGLVVARQLSKAGMHITVLEARGRIGGRIYTLQDAEFTMPVELGAEFIHGKLPTTIKLLKEYAISYSPAKGQVWHVRKDEFKKDKSFVDEHHRLLEKKLNQLKRDVPVNKFLHKHFKEKEYAPLRKSITGFVEGYESAEMERFSTFAFREDWLKAEDWEQYRVDGGYGKLINALADESKKNGCEVHLSTVVKKIQWKKGLVEIMCERGNVFTASKAVITVPLSVLQEEKILFFPALSEKIKAVKQLGYGNVIKIIFRFRAKFWENKALHKRLGENLDKLFFLFSEAPIPTWWTQYPASSNLLIGWLSGSKAKERMFNTDKEILEEALHSLAVIFDKNETVLKEKLVAWKVANWSKDEFTRGSYAYATVGSEKHIKKLEKPVKNTLFFAGEIFSEGGGTVEDAFVSGFKVAAKILAIP